MTRTGRFPSSRLPEGWFPVGWAHELGNGDVKSLRYFDRDLVMWRGESGHIALQDAFCLHLGAHRGVGGTTVGDDLACPWHGWRWGADGHNTCIPYSAEGSKRQLKIRTFPVREWCGVIIAWHSHDDTPPTWELPEIPEYGRDDFYDMHPVSEKLHRVRCHPQMPIENSVDPAHVQYVHGAGEIPEQVSYFADGPWFQSNVKITYGAGRKRTSLTPNGPVKTVFESNSYGVGLSIVRWEEPLPTIQFTGFVPVDEEHIDYYFAQCSARQPEADKSEPRDLARIFLEAQWKAIVQDFPIWENMTYLERPHFAAEESKAYTALRRWATQFYPREDGDRMLSALGEAP
jgi:phenylpropionate dioxygenase-like ring-hydroxylating dioxygenase large terminal subunit